jgi:hypothetical protein
MCKCIGVLAALSLMLAAANGVLGTTVTNTATINTTIDNYWWTGDPLSVEWDHSNPVNGTVYDLALSRGVVTNVSLRIYTDSWDTGSAPVQVSFTDAVGGTHGLGNLTQGAASSLFSINATWLDDTSVKAGLTWKLIGSVGVHISTSDLTVTYTNDAPIAEAGGLYALEVYDGQPATLDVSAAGSTDDGLLSALKYAWDLDGNGSYETDAGTSATYSITDPHSLFGDLSGTKTIGLKVFDGEYYVTDTATVDYTYYPPQQQPPGPGIPEPVTMAGLVLGLGSLAGYIRRRRTA